MIQSSKTMKTTNETKAPRRCCSANQAKAKDAACREYPGAAIDAADNDRVTKRLEKQETKTLNNNPRNDDM